MATKITLRGRSTYDGSDVQKLGAVIYSNEDAGRIDSLTAKDGDLTVEAANVTVVANLSTWGLLIIEKGSTTEA